MQCREDATRRRSHKTQRTRLLILYRTQQSRKPSYTMTSSTAASVLPFTAELTAEMSSIQPRETFVSLNNSAIDLLRHEKNDEALELLSRASSQTTELTVIPSETSARISCEAIHHETVVRTVNVDDESNDSANCLDDTLDDEGSPSNFFILYNRVFVFEDVNFTQSNNWMRVLPHVPAVLHYNTALVWHRMALKLNSATHYSMALEKYNMAHNLIIRHAQMGIYHAHVCDVLLLALCNNMGQIHSHFFRLDNARLCCEELFAIFFLSSGENTRVLTKDEYVFFYMSILLTMNRRPILAPAA